MEIMQGKRCLITGANSGIGKETAKALAQMGAEVIMVCRNPEKGQAALEEIVTATGNDRVVLRTCDLASLKQIQALARRLEAEFDHLDVLINNAGVYQKQRQISADGFELMFAVNHLAPAGTESRVAGLAQASPSGPDCQCQLYDAPMGKSRLRRPAEPKTLFGYAGLLHFQARGLAHQLSISTRVQGNCHGQRPPPRHCGDQSPVQPELGPAIHDQPSQGRGHLDLPG